MRSTHKKQLHQKPTIVKTTYLKDTVHGRIELQKIKEQRYPIIRYDSSSKGVFICADKKGNASLRISQNKIGKKLKGKGLTVVVFTIAGDHSSSRPKQFSVMED